MVDMDSLLSDLKLEIQVRYGRVRDNDNLAQESEKSLRQCSRTLSSSRPLLSSLSQEDRPTSTGPDLVVEEFMTYYTEKWIAKSNDSPFSPLTYWKQNSKRFPRLSQVALQVFCVPASSGNIERVFSTAGDIMSAKRNRLSPNLFETLLLIKKNKTVMSKNVD